MEKRSRKEREIKHIRRDILVAAARAFVRRGYQGTTMEEVAKEAGYATSSLYTYFNGKDDLYGALIATIAEEFDAPRQDPILAKLDFRDRLEWLLRKRFEVVERNREFVVLFLSHRPTFDCGLDSAPAELARQAYGKWIEQAAELLSTGMDEGAIRHADARDLAYLLVGVVNAAVFRWVSGENTDGLQSAVPSLLELIMHGIAARELEQ